MHSSEQDYTNTRHNVGFLILSALHENNDFGPWEKDAFLHALVCVGMIGSEKYTLVKPQTFMNNSGDTVRGILKRGATVEDIIVVYDDLAYPFGVTKIAHEKGDGGHNGIKSITNVLGASYVRIRVGIHSYIPGSDPKALISLVGVDRADFVLKDFRPDELSHIGMIGEQVKKILLSIDTIGVAKTMTEFNQSV